MEEIKGKKKKEWKRGPVGWAEGLKKKEKKRKERKEEGEEEEKERKKEGKGLVGLGLCLWV